MSIVAGLKYLHLAYFSRPEADRPLYRAIRRSGAKKLLALGIGDCHRVCRMIAAAANFGPALEIRFVGIDQFEGRPDEGPPGVSLKEAYLLLKATGASIQWLPGNPFTALARSANSLGPMDFIVIAADQDAPSLERAWFYVPRLLRASTRVFQEVTTAGEEATQLREMSMGDIETRVAGRTRRAA